MVDLKGYQDKLEEYFRIKSENSRCFVLDHNLEDDEYSEMLNGLQEEFSEKGMMRKQFYLPYLVVLSELGFQFSGKMYWDLPKKTFPSELYWENYNDGGGRVRSRAFFLDFESKFNIEVIFPKLEYCTDNAAMIAMAGSIRWHNQMGNQPLNTEVDINPSLELGSGY